jgi:ethanolamine utilization protein EutJ
VVNLAEYLARAEKVILPSRAFSGHPKTLHADENLHVGVDLGTAYLVLVVLDERFQPLAGEYQFAQVVKDGLVVDFIGAIDRLKAMRSNVEKRLGFELKHAASGFPPGVPQVEVRATANVVEAAGMECTGLLDEPTAANNLLNIQNGAIVDVGGGTTGIAVVKDGRVVYSADEATGGTHFSLVIAGANNISFEEAEELKKDPAEQVRLFPVIYPVMEKVASIITRHLIGRHVDQITIVGGTACFPGLAGVVEEYTGIPTLVPERPLFITPIGIAMHDNIKK